MLSSILCLLLLGSSFWVSSSALSSKEEPDFGTNETFTRFNNASIIDIIIYDDHSMARLILKTEGNDSIPLPPFGCGFICPGNDDTWFFAVVLLGGRNASVANQQVWLANRDKPIRENGKLEFKAEGGLVLRDSDDKDVWSSGTSGKSLVGIELGEEGSLRLYNSNNTVWESFDEPSDNLLPGQMLRKDAKLVASASTNDWSRGQYDIQMTSDGVTAYVQAAVVPLKYLHLEIRPYGRGCQKNYGCREPGQPSTTHAARPRTKSYAAGQRQETYAVHDGENLDINIEETSNSYQISSESANRSYHYLRLGFDGHLRTYKWQQSIDPEEIYDLVTQQVDNCQHPNVCGDYGICEKEGRCSCPNVRISGSDYFKQIEGPSFTGCSENVNFSCQSRLHQQHQLVDVGNLSYFSFIDSQAAAPNFRNLYACKKACSDNCTCRAAFFKYKSNISDGECYLLYKIMSIRANPLPGIDPYNSSAFIKVQLPYLAPSPRPGNGTVSPSSSPHTPWKKNHLAVLILGSTAVVIVALCIVISKKNKKKKNNDEEEEYFQHVLKMPKRFTYEELSAATDDFKEQLGGGGFGTVFKGELEDGMRIAVKRLDNRGQGMKEFLAEVETIGNVNHFNLVHLIGFCTDKSYQLLVYEYMSKGSLDKWIFNRQKNMDINWQTRKKIILDIARGLAYLHEECRQRIVHLDIKPQNILLDDDFNAKVSDFGLSKLMARDQSQVETNMRGTPGYLAPEWQQLRITLKVDVYSFGIVVLEIICGRKNLDRFRSETSMHLLRLLQEKAEANHVIDIVQNSSMDTQLHEDEVLKMIKLAAWCLQDDHTRRPQMSMVVKVLEGGMEIEPNISYRFCNAMARSPTIAADSEPPQASVLSAPR